MIEFNPGNSMEPEDFWEEEMVSRLKDRRNQVIKLIGSNWLI